VDVNEFSDDNELLSLIIKLHPSAFQIAHILFLTKNSPCFKRNAAHHYRGPVR